MIVVCLSVMVKLEKCGTEEQNARLSAYLEDTEEKTPAEMMAFFKDLEAELDGGAAVR